MRNMLGICFDDFDRSIGRLAINNDVLNILVILFVNRPDTILQVFFGIVGNCNEENFMWWFNEK
jgi:hypothetical protein